jgi:hypothetical protein
MKICKHCGVEHNMRGNSCRVCKDNLYLYNLNRNEIMVLHESQNGNCALCNKSVAMFNGGSYNSGNIDHCHSTGKVRGILCHQCNTYVGYFENKMTFDKLKNYLGVA